MAEGRRKKTTAADKPKKSLTQARQTLLSRKKALRRVHQLLSTNKVLVREAIQMISQYHFHTDDLTEAGISYEMVRAIEKRYPLLLQE